MLKGFGGAGVLEVIEGDRSDTYQAVYTVKFAEAVLVLHCFQKKSTHGIATSKVDLDLIRARLKVQRRGLRSCDMKKRLIDGIEVHRGSRNVFADLGLPDADTLKIKTGLVIEIRRAIHQEGLTQQEAAARMGLTQPKVSAMMRGDFSNVSERKLMECLNRLGYDIEIKVRPASASVGHLMLALP